MPGFAAQSNTYVPSFDASGRYIVGFSRNPASFALAQYAQYVQTQRDVGYYLKLTAQEAARVVSQDDYIWPDGGMEPQLSGGNESFEFKEFRCERYAYGFNIGWLATQQADWPIVEQHGQIHAAKCMTARTNRAATVLTTAANWATSADPDLSANHSDTATNLGGGFWSAGTSTDPNIKQSLDNIAVQINRDTLGVIDGDASKLMLIVNPSVARVMGESAEVHDFIKGSVWARQELDTGTHRNGKYGLPSILYGYQIVVENTVRVTSRKGATLAKGHAFPDNTAVVVSRPGGIEGVYGGPSFSTLTIFCMEEMTVERKDDADNRLTRGRVVENCKEVLTAPASGFLVTNVLS